jgi:hypothetical protein
LCASTSTCVSFAIWTNINAGYCQGYTALCTDPCSNPTNAEDGYTNDVYHMW